MGLRGQNNSRRFPDVCLLNITHSQISRMLKFLALVMLDGKQPGAGTPGDLRILKRGVSKKAV